MLVNNKNDPRNHRLEVTESETISLFAQIKGGKKEIEDRPIKDINCFKCKKKGTTRTFLPMSMLIHRGRKM